MGQISDFQSGKPLELRQLPQLDGYKLVMVEHTHPVATRPLFGANGFAAPSNADMYIAAANPGIVFVINQALVSNAFNKVTKSNYIYYGF